MKILHWITQWFFEPEPCSWCGRRIWFCHKAANGWLREDGSVDLWHKHCREKWKAARDQRWPGWRTIPDDLRPVRMRSRFVYHWYADAHLEPGEHDEKPLAAGLYALERLHPPPRRAPTAKPMGRAADAAD